MSIEILRERRPAADQFRAYRTASDDDERFGLFGDAILELADRVEKLEAVPVKPFKVTGEGRYRQRNGIVDTLVWDEKARGKLQALNSRFYYQDGGDGQIFATRRDQCDLIARLIEMDADQPEPILNQDIVNALKHLLAYTRGQLCDHEETQRGGAIRTICDDCGMKWADDEGGFKPDPIPDAILQAEAAITAYEATKKENR